MLNKLRGIFVVICFVIFGIGTLFMGYIIFPIIKFLNPDKTRRLDVYSCFVQKSWQLFIEFLRLIKIIDIKTKDIKKLQNIKNSIIVSTHPSFIDGIILISLIPKTTCLVAERLSKNFVFKNIIKSMFILSNGNLENILSETQDMFEQGFNMLIFPAGRRHTINEHPKIRRGASLMALYTQKDIVPIRMTTNIPFLQINQPIYKAVDDVVTYKIEVGEKISLNEYTENIEDTVILKRDITKKITNSLYNS